MPERMDENMIIDQKSNKQALGQFFTPLEVVSFIYDVLKVILSRDEKWTQGKYPSIIDPACGEGIFLKVALDKKITRPKYVFGIDIDEQAKQKWQEINLLKSFGSKAKMDLHFHHQDGLLPLPQRTLRYKRGGLNQYDLVVGNPPYGGVGLKEKITPLLEKVLLKFDLWRKAFKESEHPDLFDKAEIETIGDKRRERLEKFPIEVLFLERFVQLAKSRGYMAIIIPDGFLANANLRYIRNWLFEKTMIRAIVSLPRETFKSVGTSAKTTILFLQKLGEEERSPSKQKIFVASAEFVGVNDSARNDLSVILQEFEKFIYGKEIKEVHMSPHFITILEGTKDTLHRIDADYWNPKYNILIEEMKKRFKIKPLGEFVSFITYGQVGKRYYDKKGTVKYLQVVNILRTGIDYWIKPATIREGSHNDPARSRLKIQDVVLVNHGVGSIGKCIIMAKDPGKVNISQDIDLIRVTGLNPFFVCIFLNTKYGQQQIERQCSGVSGIVYIRFDDIKSIQIPIIPEAIQQKIEAEYRKMSKYHDLAMEAKARVIKKRKSLIKEAKQDTEYQRNIQKAEKILNDLIKRTEEVIEGKRSDIH